MRDDLLADLEAMFATRGSHRVPISSTLAAQVREAVAERLIETNATIGVLARELRIDESGFSKFMRKPNASLSVGRAIHIVKCLGGVSKASIAATRSLDEKCWKFLETGAF